eukprot:scpid77001/ scgid32232/ 
MVYAEYVGYYYLPSALACQLQRACPGYLSLRGVRKVLIERAKRQYNHRVLDAEPVLVSIDVTKPQDSSAEPRLVVQSSVHAQQAQFSSVTLGRRRGATAQGVNVKDATSVEAARRRSTAALQTREGSSCDSLAGEKRHKQYCDVVGSNLLLSMYVGHLFSFLERHPSCCTSPGTYRREKSHVSMLHGNKKRKSASSSSISSVSSSSSSSS